MTGLLAPPVLETERLILRGHEERDYDACVALWSDPAITQHTIGAPSPAQRTWIRLLAYRGHWSLLGFGYWLVQEKSSGRYVGELGYADFKRELDPPMPAIAQLPELGWALARAAHGKGYATEALHAACAWGDAAAAGGDARFARTACLISPENAASLNVARKIGFREIGRTTQAGVEEKVFTRG